MKGAVEPGRCASGRPRGAASPGRKKLRKTGPDSILNAWSPTGLVRADTGLRRQGHLAQGSRGAGPGGNISQSGDTVVYVSSVARTPVGNRGKGTPILPWR